MSSYDNWKTTNPADEQLGRSRGTPEPYRCLDCPWRGRGVLAASEHYWAMHAEHRVKQASDPRFGARDAAQKKASA